MTATIESTAVTATIESSIQINDCSNNIKQNDKGIKKKPNKRYKDQESEHELVLRDLDRSMQSIKEKSQQILNT